MDAQRQLRVRAGLSCERPLAGGERGKNKNGWRWGRQTEMRTRPTKDLPWRVLEDVEKDLQEGGQKKADWGGLSSMEGVGPRPPPNRRRRRPAFVACVPFVWENLPRCGQRLGDV